MDDDFVFNEKQSIRDSSRSLKKYGSTCCNQNIRNNETLVRHEIEKTDTLQGIALKYGCTTEQIRRANRLFASDSLFLRQFLMVPVDKSSIYYPNGSNNSQLQNDMISSLENVIENDVVYNGSSGGGGDPLNCTSSSTLSSNSASSSSMSTDSNPRPAALPTRPYSIAGELLVQANDTDTGLSMSNNGNTAKQSKSLDSVAASTMTPEEESRRSINEFLSKIDNTISESRKYVEKSKEMISNQTDNDLFVATEVVSRRRNNNINNSYKKQNQHQNPTHQRHSSTGSNSDTANLLNTTQMRRVHKRLEKQQDDFFEL
ncbi:lysM and putative peptidoglycan-binding domain-containing protein 2 isoform X2 [Stomoxys calcitrans]|nr:lysM and putative peptidoglycan-binding domain-containing protein 2 isoform X2 [Stomoxys calcitrans]XP_013097417.1 lysM and putative peptidoglycan-binding domain-containing protein 2 isoform X2 [Stomoxys calcitrans]